MLIVLLSVGICHCYWRATKATGVRSSPSWSLVETNGQAARSRRRCSIVWEQSVEMGCGCRRTEPVSHLKFAESNAVSKHWAVGEMVGCVILSKIISVCQSSVNRSKVVNSNPIGPISEQAVHRQERQPVIGLLNRRSNVSSLVI